MKRHPVYISHLSEVEATTRLIRRALLKAHRTKPENREIELEWLEGMKKRLDHLRLCFTTCAGGIAYFGDRDFEDIRKIAGFIKTYPELLQK